MALSPSNIDWTDKVWNPITGCTPISMGCANCYAMALIGTRLRHMPKYANGSTVTCHSNLLNAPLGCGGPAKVFVNSMSDAFHVDVPLPFLEQMFVVMGRAHWLTFQILTKRADRLAALAPHLTWHPNIWMGVTVEHHSYLNRLALLKTVPAAVRFVSFEPLLSPMPGLNLQGIHWVIVGGETGNGAREMDEDWARDIRDACINQGVPFFYKQRGSYPKKRGKGGNTLDGVVWHQYP